MFDSVLVMVFSTMFIDTITAQFISARIDSKQIEVKEGDQPKLSCHARRSTEKIQWQMIGRNGLKKVISENNSVVESLKDRYAINLLSKPRQSEHTVELSFTNGVRFADDGIYKCVVLLDTNNVIAEAQTNLIVLKSMDKMTLSIGDTEFDTAATSAHSISLPIGNYMSTCKTLGSNPASVIKIYLDDVEVGINKKSISALDNSLMYNTEKKVKLTIGPEHQNQILRCAGIVNDDNTLKGEISLKLDIIRKKKKCNCKWHKLFHTNCAEISGGTTLQP